MNIFPLFIDKESHEEFRMKIVKYIIAKRIYRDEDLENLKNQLISKNKHLLPEEEIKKNYEKVIEELEN
jgi:hypothetical protein